MTAEIVQPIELLAAACRSRIGAKDVYFAFASGRLTYDCVACGATCCRGYDYVSRIGSEINAQIALRPSLQFFVQPPGPAGSAQLVHNCPPACFFLTDGNLCELHCQNGYKAKPETCRLFPFNDLSAVGGYLVVSPHGHLCPLRVVEGEPTGNGSAHDDLLRAMSDQGISNQVRQAVCLHRDVASVVALERQIVALTEQCLGSTPYPECAALQFALTADAGLTRSHESGGAPTCADVVEFLDLCRKVLGMSPLCAHVDPVDRTVTALTPYLRARLVFRPATRTAQPGPGVSEIERVPYSLLVTRVMVMLARESGMRDITFQTIARICQIFSDVITVLADANRPMVWRGNVPLDLSCDTAKYATPYIRIAKALLPSTQRRHKKRLGEILADGNPFTGLERVGFLKFVVSRLAERLVPCDATRRVRGSLRCQLQRWTADVVDERTLRIVCNRRFTEVLRGH